MRFRSAALLLVGLFVSPLAAQAQDTSRYEVAGGYSFLHDKDISESLHGWVVSGAGRVMDWVDLVGEVGGNYKTLSIPGDAPKIKVRAFMVGPRFKARAYGHLVPFAQVLFGAAWASTQVLGVGDDSGKKFAYQPGGGVDWKLGPRVGVRLEGDYRIIRAEGTSKEPRFVAAAVFGFGK